MSITDIQKSKYPIGNFTPPASITEEDMRGWIEDIKLLPGKLRLAVISLNEKQLDTPYRLGGWTIRQLVHHIADSHANALLRFKFALTEDNPTIKPYAEADWAMLPDYKTPIEGPLRMLEGIHLRWVSLLEGMTEEQWDRTYFHPENKQTSPLRKVLALYSWHCNHHLAHISNATL